MGALVKIVYLYVDMYLKQVEWMENFSKSNWVEKSVSLKSITLSLYDCD